VIAPPEERPAPLFDAQAQTRFVPQPFGGIQDVRERIDEGIVTVPDAGAASNRRTTVDYYLSASVPLPPAGFGIVVGPRGEVLTHATALRGRTEVALQALDVETVIGRVAGYEPSSGLVLLTVTRPRDALRTPTFAAAPEPGALAAAYFRTRVQESVVPVFITSVGRDTYTLDSSGGMLKPGTPIYNLSGQLLAVATGAHRTAIPARHAAERLLAQLEAGAPQPASLGVTFQPLAGAITSVFGQTGALVADVVPGGPAAAAGVSPGDLVLAVGADVVQTPEAAHSAIVRLPIDEPGTVRVKRNDEMLVLTVSPASAFVVAALATSPRLDEEGRGIVAGDMFGGQRLAAAGISRDARVISINASPVSSLTDARRELQRNPSRVLVHLRDRDGNRFFAVVEPAS
jgi:serine protease Do